HPLSLGCLLASRTYSAGVRRTMVAGSGEAAPYTHTTTARSARFAPVGRGQQSLQRSVVQSGGIALAFHRQAPHRARQLVRFHSFVADRLERQPRFVESFLY